MNKKNRKKRTKQLKRNELFLDNIELLTGRPYGISDDEWKLIIDLTNNEVSPIIPIGEHKFKILKRDGKNYFYRLVRLPSYEDEGCWYIVLNSYNDEIKILKNMLNRENKLKRILLDGEAS